MGENISKLEELNFIEERITKGKGTEERVPGDTLSRQERLIRFLKQRA